MFGLTRKTVRRLAPMRSPLRPFNSKRSVIDRMEPEHALYGIVGANGLVFMMWQTSQTWEKKKFMVENFTTSLSHLKAGRVHTLVTSAFSQMSTSHFLLNGLGLYFFGIEVCRLLGAKRFLGLYLSSAVAASLCQIGYDSYQGRKTIMLGASGAVNAITSFYICAFPHSTIYIMAILPLPAYVAGGLFILRDLWGATSTSGNIGNVAHLGGAACGVLFYRRLYQFRRFF
ncbi:serine protease family S54 [Thraustotheca clavata]|uniref:Serine protease family S54 n=1 Tax=Thraustotheca clavata TaxID=74557 RepID=A0A1V9Z1X8_9STRA|nr:serine protease family S54 [Thraustotheca clavata]